MRLIDADNLESLCDIMADKCDGIGESIWNQFRTVVEWLPTIDVVRCKDCIYWGTHFQTKDGKRGSCMNFEVGTKADFFCAFGETMKEDRNGTV